MAVFLILWAATLVLVRVLGFETALGLDTTLALATLLGLARLLLFAGLFGLGVPLRLARTLGFEIVFDVKGIFLLILGVAFRDFLVTFLVTEALFFLDLSFLFLLDFMDRSSDENVRRLTAVHIRTIIKALIS